MTLYIWSHVEGMTDSYHSAAGVVVVAADLGAAMAAVIEAAHDKLAATEAGPPDAAYALADGYEPAIYIHEDAGCC